MPEPSARRVLDLAHIEAPGLTRGLYRLGRSLPMPAATPVWVMVPSPSRTGTPPAWTRPPPATVGTADPCGLLQQDGVPRGQMFRWHSDSGSGQKAARLRLPMQSSKRACIASFLTPQDKFEGLRRCCSSRCGKSHNVAATVPIRVAGPKSDLAGNGVHLSTFLFK